MAAYGLRKSGNRGALIDRLRTFAKSGQQGWETQLLQPDHTRERGDISTHAARSNPTSQRILKLFGPKNQSTVFLPKRNGHEVRPIGVLSQQRRETNDEWAKFVLEKSSRQHLRTSGSEPQAPQVPNSVLEGTDEDGVLKITSARRMERRIASCHQEMVNQFDGIQSELSCLRSEFASLATTATKALFTSPHTGQNSPRESNSHTRTMLRPASQSLTIAPVADSSGPFTPVTSSSSEDGQFGLTDMTVMDGQRSSEFTQLAIGDHARAPAVSCPNTHATAAAAHVTPPFNATHRAVLERDAIPPANLLAFDFDDGTTLYFDKTWQVPNPPKVTFADDLSQLFKEWYVSDLLLVNGRGIPVKDWDRFYKKRIGIKQHAWELVRVQWGTWKFIVTERQRFASEELFWAHYSDKDGNRLNFKTICDLLQDGRKENDERDAAAARWFFGNDLADPAAHNYFHYKKSGKRYLCTKVQTIAAKWRQLLREHREVAQQWDRVRDQFTLAEDST
ncbi:hypothetical protein LXA43DRAFT_1096140 [Ganoderma leucocontextum]|nr:hypothetical protein LXA43DRAFT_1096140 [Ganoderma leucocontextum]